MANVICIKKLKSCRASLTNHTGSIFHHIMPLVINALRGGLTNIHAPILIPLAKVISITKHRPATKKPLCDIYVFVQWSDFLCNDFHLGMLDTLLSLRKHISWLRSHFKFYATYYICINMLVILFTIDKQFILYILEQLHICIHAYIHTLYM